MSYDITLVYPDAGATDPAELYLPGELVPGVDGPDHCGICDEPIDHYTDTDGTSQYGDIMIGDHRGVIVTRPIQGEVPAYSEPLHLRCVMDGADQYGAIGFFTQASELTHPEGRHLKSA